MCDCEAHRTGGAPCTCACSPSTHVDPAVAATLLAAFDERHAVPPGSVCALHRFHRPTPLRLVVHHVWPVGMGGPNRAVNREIVCDTGHANVHELLAALVAGEATGRRGTAKERAMAQLGYDRWVEAGRPSGPTPTPVTGELE
jgi:hypothetical protein